MLCPIIIRFGWYLNSQLFDRSLPLPEEHKANIRSHLPGIRLWLFLVFLMASVNFCSSSVIITNQIHIVAKRAIKRKSIAFHSSINYWLEHDVDLQQSQQVGIGPILFLCQFVIHSLGWLGFTQIPLFLTLIIGVPLYAPLVYKLNK